MACRWIEANGVAFRYELAGPKAAPALALIHEIGGMLESWNGVVDTLSSRYRILRYDQRGSGLSEKPPGKIRIDDLADDLAALLHAVGLAGPVAIVGTAMGAAVAIRFATRYPDIVARLVLMSPATFLPEERRATFLARANDLARFGFRAVEQVDPGLDLERRLRSFGNDPQGVAAMMRLLAELDLEADLGRISCPTLVLAGARDAWRPPPLVEKIASSIPRCLYRIVASGHAMALDTPELVAFEIAGFLG